MQHRWVILVCLSASLIAHAAGSSKAPARPAAKSASVRKQFVLDVVRSAVALPQPDPQDRLRVLSSAANVIAPINIKMAHQFAREGARLEAELAGHGIRPAVSIVSGGFLECSASAQFVESIPESAVPLTEDSLVGAITLCQKEALEPAKRKLESALNNGIVSARPLMALMDSSGPNSAWSQSVFTKMFSSLPLAPESEEGRREAPNFAAMFLNSAPKLDPAVAGKAGIKLLEWLAKVPASGDRNLAVNMTTDGLKQIFKGAAYDDLLAQSATAQSIARTAGQPGEIQHPEEESVSVLQAMDESKKDRTEEIGKMPASLRAREAAAHGFAAGTSGNRKLADRYFDMAFSAVDSVWADRTPEKDAPAVVAEVSEAAAHVDAVAALQRSRHLQDPSAQAISMLSVARVVVGQD